MTTRTFQTDKEARSIENGGRIAGARVRHGESKYPPHGPFVTSNGPNYFSSLFRKARDRDTKCTQPHQQSKAPRVQIQDHRPPF